MNAKTPKSPLLAHARRVAREVEDAGSVDDYLYERSRREPEPPAEWASPATLLASAMLREALPKRTLTRLLSPNGIALCVQVANVGWVEPVQRALLGQGVWGEAMKRDGSSRLSDTPSTGNAAIAEALARGRNVFGVSQNPSRYLPAALTALADIRLNLGTPSTRAIASVIARITGTRPRGLPADLARGLSAETVIGCIRPGSSRDCVRRLIAASRAQDIPGQDQGSVPVLADTHGYGEEVMTWASSIVTAVQEYTRGERSWHSIENKNIVLSGDAGTGKSTFARILSKSTGLPLYSTSVSTWFSTTNGYLNDICKAVDAAFSQAAADGPAILLLDELDSIPNRATMDNRNRDYWIPVVSHILLALDSAVSGASSSLIVIGATNFPQRLDEALVRPGRLNRIIHVERPDTAAIAGIMRQHLGDALPDEDLLPVATIGAGATGAEVAGWVKGARMAARSAGRDLRLQDLLEQLSPPETRSPELLWATALHEAAHCAHVEDRCPNAVLSVSIVPRGPFAGRTTTTAPAVDRMGAEEMDAFVCSILAGRAADEHWHVATAGSSGGPGSDLSTATAVLAGKHGTYGLGGSLLYRGDANEAQILLRVDPTFRRLVEENLTFLYARVQIYIREHADLIEAIAKRLVDRRVLGGNEVRAIIRARAPGRTDDRAVRGVHV